MSTVVKRKRGRPRRDDSREISDFDLNLIQEYKKHVEFYDPNHPNRNRSDLEFAWLTMARSTGNSVNLVKSRMLQLRNRYNLEKRRIEMLQHQYQDPTITSQWPLYEKLSFLGDHTRTRRTLPNALPLRPKNQPPSSSESENDEGNKNERSFSNGVALQPPPSLSPVHHMVTRQHVMSLSNDNEDAPIPNECTTTKKLRMNEELQNQDATIFKGHDDTTNPNLVVNRNGGVRGARCGAAGTGDEKFKAFGHFLASSLMEINEKDALRLIEKFTSDLVCSLLAETCNSTESSSSKNPQ